MKKTIIAVAIALASMTVQAANNPEDWRVSYASVMDHYNAGRLSQAYAELPRLGLSGAQLDAAWDAIKSGQTWTNMGDFDKWLGGNGNQNPGNGNGNGGNGKPTSYDKQQDVKIDSKADKAAFEADQKRQDDALAAAVDKQAGVDAGQNDHINAVQDAAQTANDRSTALEGRADAVEGAVRETNTQLAVTDGRSINNAERLDGVEQANTRQDGQIAGNTAAIGQEVKDRIAGDAKTLTDANGYTDGAVKQQADKQQLVDAKQDGAITDNAAAIKNETTVRSQQFTQLSAGVEQAQATGEYAHSRIDAANANIEANRTALANTNKRVAANTAQLANHEQRLSTLEQQTSKGFSDLKRQIDDNKKDANAGISGVAAIASIPQVTDKQDFSVGAGVGARGSEQALAVGFSGRITDNVVTKVAVATDTQSGWTVGAGVSYGW